jgi:hypothetical protein
MQRNGRPSRFVRDKPIFSSERCYIKKILAVGLKGLAPRRTDWR